MRNFPPAIVFLSGAGGGAPDLNIFRRNAEDATRFEIVNYPGWKRYSADGYSADVLIADLVSEMSARVPQGPICIVGVSIGGHLGYAAALRLQAMGREIAGFCAIDTFMMGSARPSAGWKGRAFAEGLELLQNWRFREFLQFLRSKFWRALTRLAGDQLPRLVRNSLPSRRSSLLSTLDPILESELSMRLLICTTAPWIGRLDREPVPLEVPSVLLRTSFAAGDDAAWKRRCPNIEIFEIPGRHHNLFEPENRSALHQTFVAATRGWHTP